MTVFPNWKLVTAFGVLTMYFFFRSILRLFWRSLWRTSAVLPTKHRNAMLFVFAAFVCVTAGNCEKTLRAETPEITKTIKSYIPPRFEVRRPTQGAATASTQKGTNMWTTNLVRANPLREQQGAPRQVSESPNTPDLSVVRVVAFDATGISFGSGSYIGNVGEYGVILSNWHVICESTGLVHVHFPNDHFPNGFSSFGAIIQSVKKWDLAVIVISRPPTSIQPIQIAKTVPKPGDSLRIAGYGHGEFRIARGNCLRYLAPEIPQDGSQPQYEIIELSVRARRGDSGGPILNDNNELAGVLFGSDMVMNTAGSYWGRVNLFLTDAAPLFQYLPPKPEVYFASIEKDGPRHYLNKSREILSSEESKQTGKGYTPVVNSYLPSRLDSANKSGARSTP